MSETQHAIMHIIIAVWLLALTAAVVLR